MRPLQEKELGRVTAPGDLPLATHTAGRRRRRIKVLREGMKKLQPGGNEIALYDTHIALVNFQEYMVF